MERPKFNGNFEDSEYKNKLLDYFIKKLPESITQEKNKLDLITEAYRLAFDAHEGQTRKGGDREPYITHPVEVALICANEMGLGYLTLMAALLHDVVEDTDVKIEEIEKLFNKKVGLLVSGVTKITTNSKENGNTQVNSLVNMLYSFKKDFRVLFIKIADRLHNMRTMEDMPDNTRQIKTGENLYIYAPLAHLAGMYKIRNELQDLSFRYRYFDIYENIKKSLDDSSESRRIKFEKYKEIINEILINNSLTNYRLDIAQKSLFSVWQKMLKYNQGFNEIHNLNSIRIVVDFDSKDEEEIRNKCYNFWISITSKINYNASTTRDWLLTPKNNGFSALVFDAFSDDGELFEIQITTEEKNQIAEKGFSNGHRFNEVFDKLAQEIPNEGESEQLSPFDIIARIQSSFITSSIKVFTPKNKEIELPKGATVLDFAFQIHSELGFRCIGAKIGGKPVTPMHRIADKDRIEVLTSKTAEPDERWQYLVVTNKAREELVKYFRKNSNYEEIYKNENIEIKNKEPLVIDEKLHYIRPKCCNALPGDDCIAYQDDKTFIHIHKRNCFQAIYYTAVDGKHTTNVIWRPIQEYDAMLKGILITGTDRKGIIRDIVNIITDELNVNMQAMDIATINGAFKGKIRLYVYDNSFLNNIINKLVKISNVSNVSIYE